MQPGGQGFESPRLHFSVMAFPDVLAFDPSIPVLRLLDQRALPRELRVLEARSLEEVAEAIETLAVRGAPLIGVAAAYGVVLAVLTGVRAEEAIARLRRTRPTAVNLFHAMKLMERVLQVHGEDVAMLLRAAQTVEQYEQEVTVAIGRAGADHLQGAAIRLMTICNTGHLATPGMGTAFAVAETLHREGRLARLWILETRPLLQGARLTAWEAVTLGLPATLLVDHQAAAVMAEGKVDAVVVGADRIARNGDTANKIGTLTLAIVAHHYGVPFYVAAPMSTFDPELEQGGQIPIESRPAREVLSCHGCPIAPETVDVRNDAFDVTPGTLIRAFFTDLGVLPSPPPRERVADSRVTLYDLPGGGAS